MKINYRREFELNTKYKYAKQEAIEYIINKGYGATILYEELGKIFSLSVTDELEFHKLKSVINKLKPVLIDYGIVIKTIINVGYYVLKPKQISGYCYHAYIRRTQKLLDKSANILNHVDLDKLSEIRMQEYNEVRELNDKVGGAIEETLYKSKYEHNREIYENLDD